MVHHEYIILCRFSYKSLSLHSGVYEAVLHSLRSPDKLMFDK